MSNIDNIREIAADNPNPPDFLAYLDQKYAEIQAEAEPFRDEDWARYLVRIDIRTALADGEDVGSITSDTRVHWEDPTKRFFIPPDRATRAWYAASLATASGLTREQPRSNEVRVLVSYTRGNTLFFVRVW